MIKDLAVKAGLSLSHVPTQHTLFTPGLRELWRWPRGFRKTRWGVGSREEMEEDGLRTCLVYSPWLHNPL